MPMQFIFSPQCSFLCSLAVTIRGRGLTEGSFKDIRFFFTLLLLFCFHLQSTDGRSRLFFNARSLLQCQCKLSFSATEMKRGFQRLNSLRCCVGSSPAACRSLLSARNKEHLRLWTSTAKLIISVRFTQVSFQHAPQKPHGHQAQVNDVNKQRQKNWSSSPVWIKGVR